MNRKNKLFGSRQVPVINPKNGQKENNYFRNQKP